MTTRKPVLCDLVTNSHFLKMSVEAQTLYMHLLINSDDDGFITAPESMCRRAKIPPQWLDELVQNGYIILFESGPAVIVHHRLHDDLPPDQKEPTVHQHELAQLETDADGLYRLRSK